MMHDAKQFWLHSRFFPKILPKKSFDLVSFLNIKNALKFLLQSSKKMSWYVFWYKPANTHFYRCISNCFGSHEYRRCKTSRFCFKNRTWSRTIILQLDLEAMSLDFGLSIFCPCVVGLPKDITAVTAVTGIYLLQSSCVRNKLKWDTTIYESM